MQVVEEQQRHVEPPPRRLPELGPAARIGTAEEVETPRQRHRVLEIGGDRDRDAAEHALEEPAAALVVALGQVEQGQVPEQVVPEVAQVVAGMDPPRQALDPAAVVAPLVVDVGDGVHRPGVPRVQRDRPLGERQRLVEAPVLLEREGVIAEGVAVVGQGRQHRAGHLEHLGRAPLPEVDVVEALHQQHVARELAQDLLHDRDRVVAAPAHEEAQGLQVPALARGERRGLGGPVRDRPLHLGRGPPGSARRGRARPRGRRGPARSRGRRRAPGGSTPPCRRRSPGARARPGRGRPPRRGTRSRRPGRTRRAARRSW